MPHQDMAGLAGPSPVLYRWIIPKAAWTLHYLTSEDRPRKSRASCVTGAHSKSPAVSDTKNCRISVDPGYPFFPFRKAVGCAKRGAADKPLSD